MGEEKKDGNEYINSFIVYLDEDDNKKERSAFVLKDIGGVWIKIEDSKPFFIPYNRILKMKPRKEEDLGYGNGFR